MTDVLTLPTLKAELAHLELRIVDRITSELNQKADRSHVEALEKDLDIIKVQGSPALGVLASAVQANTRDIGDLKETKAAREHYFEAFTKHVELCNTKQEAQDNEIKSLWGSRNRMYGALAVVTFLMPVLATISWHLWG